jgi:obg-like ATPase 1
MIGCPRSAFDDPDVIHHDDEVNPLGDLDMITQELLLKDLENAEKQFARVEPLVRRGIDKTKKNELEAINKVIEVLKAGKQIRHAEWKPAEADFFRPYGLLTAKPVVYLVNVSKRDYLRKKNKYLVPIKGWIDEHSPGEKMIVYSAAFESEVADIEEEEARETFLKDNATKSQMDNVIQAGFHALNLISFITAGPTEVRMWTIYNGWKCPKAAGVIHSDFEDYFIKADVYAFSDLKELGSEAAVKEAGKLRMEGKEYVVKDGDVLHIKANPPASGKKK